MSWMESAVTILSSQKNWKPWRRNSKQSNSVHRMYAVQVDKLTKVFGKKWFVAVKRISFNVEEGEAFGLLGPYRVKILERRAVLFVGVVFAAADRCLR